ncbi:MULTISPECIES: hypothetical protein [unclassified Romboutsia]|nr:MULTISPECIES: hypothetical protein [unclassified Romboutsia]SCG99457.1 Uncharacterised protein [uncultured Clostridium sp.]
MRKVSESIKDILKKNLINLIPFEENQLYKEIYIDFLKEMIYK